MQHRTKPLRILLVAPTCDSSDTGEAWSSYQWVHGIARHHEVTILTYSKANRPTLSAQLSEAGVNARVVEWRDIPFAEHFERLNSMLKPGYAWFYARARKWIKQALARGEHFDGAHQLGPLALRYPSPLAGLGIPWLLGPLAGSIEAPSAFGAKMGKAPWYTKLRQLDALRLRHDPFLRHSIRDADAVLAVAPYVSELLRPIGPKRVIIESETGLRSLPRITSQRDTSPIGRRGPCIIRVLFVGHIIRTKGLLFALQALASMKEIPWQFDIAGCGPDENACRSFVNENSLQPRVRFHGHLPRGEVNGLYAQADLFLFPSFREPSGNVVKEALAHALPVLCCASGGPGSFVEDYGSICVPAPSPNELVDNLRVALRRLFAQPEKLFERGLQGRRCIEKRDLWAVKIERLLGHYAGVFRPDLRSPAPPVSQAANPMISMGLKAEELRPKGA